MKLTDLDAKFLRYSGDGCRKVVESIAEADGVQFACPKCYTKHGGLRGTHFICCWFTGRVPNSASPGPGRWNPSGTSLADLTFVAPDSTSVRLLCGCEAHFFIRNGQIEMC